VASCDRQAKCHSWRGSIGRFCRPSTRRAGNGARQISIVRYSVDECDPIAEWLKSILCHVSCSIEHGPRRCATRPAQSELKEQRRSSLRSCSTTIGSDVPRGVPLFHQEVRETPRNSDDFPEGQSPQ